MVAMVNTNLRVATCRPICLDVIQRLEEDRMIHHQERKYDNMSRLNFQWAKVFGVKIAVSYII